MTANLTRFDLVVFFLSLILVIVLYANFWGGDAQAKNAEILISGKKQYIIDLKEEKILNISGKLGNSVLEIKDGQIRFIESPCSSKFCVRSGWMSQANGLLACLPNGVSVHLTGPNARFDSINF